MDRPIAGAAEFIERCIAALGGEPALRNVSSIYYQLERRCWMVDDEPRVLRIDVYRARGGRIRIEEFADEERREAVILNGLHGVRQQLCLKEEKLTVTEQQELDALEVEKIKRSVRLYPRNFLAHADEHQYEFRGLQQIEGESVYVLELPVEEVTYHFHADTLQCLRMHDRRDSSVISYEDYRVVEEISTPFVERKIQAERNFTVDTIQTIDYNRDLEDRLFDVF